MVQKREPAAHTEAAMKQLDDFEEQFEKRYRYKKWVNSRISFLIVFCGVSAVLYSVFVFHNSLINRLRYMTFDGTIFTTVISLFSGFVFLLEGLTQTEVTKRAVYFLRLSAACTEFVIFIVVMFGLSPLVPDQPDISSYPGVMMHLVIPALMLGSFMFNDAPIGRLKPVEPFLGTIFITIYAVIMFILFGFGILPPSLAPYSFLDFSRNSMSFKLLVLVVIYVVGYAISLALSIMNRKLSWIWFAGIDRSKVSTRIRNGDK